MRNLFILCSLLDLMLVRTVLKALFGALKCSNDSMIHPFRLDYYQNAQSYRNFRYCNIPKSNSAWLRSVVRLSGKQILIKIGSLPGWGGESILDTDLQSRAHMSDSYWLKSSIFSCHQSIVFILLWATVHWLNPFLLALVAAASCQLQ